MRGGVVRLLAVLVFLLSSVSAVSDKPELQQFLRCLNSTTSTPINDAVRLPQDPTFQSDLEAYVRNGRFLTSDYSKPVAIIAAQHESHVQATVICGKKHGFQIRTRSGGHDYEGLSYTSSVPFIVLDMFNLRAITVDLASKTAWVQSGATLGELYWTIANASNTLAFPAGTCPSVGVGGHISGAGYGNLMRKHGLTVDHVVDALVVDVNGKTMNRSEMGEDLFWAIRGGGGASFGVILAWKLRLVVVPEIVTACRVSKTTEEGALDALYRWQLVSTRFPDDVFMEVGSYVGRDNRTGEKTVSVSFLSQFLGSADEFVALVNQKLPELRLKRVDCSEMSWIDSVMYWSGLPEGSSIDGLLKRSKGPGGAFKSKSDYVQIAIPKLGIREMWESMMKMEGAWMQWAPYGGIMDRISQTATPYSHRKGTLFKIQYYVSWSGDDNDNLKLMRDMYEVATPYVSSNPRSAFLNYRDLDLGNNPSDRTDMAKAMEYGRKYFSRNLERLMRTKAKYDPDNFFKNEQSIPPLA